jgi:hypothetical protein
MMQRLNLTSKEAEPLILDDEGDDDLPCPDWALVGKVLAPNTLHVNTIRAVVTPAWGNPRGLIVRPLGPNMFLAEFGSEADKIRVAKGGPWTLNKNAILLKDFDARTKPEDVVFDELPVWARIMKLGYELMNAERGTPLAAKLGKVEKLEVDENGRAWGSYLRVRVVTNATEPIMRCVSVFSRRRNSIMQYDVMYEKLLMFCFSCGRLGHSSLLCPTPAERDAEGKLPYSGDRLCILEKKKEVSASSEQSHASKFSRKGTEMGSGSQGSTPAGGQPRKPDGSGEATSPIKNAPRGRRATAAGKTPVSAAGMLVISPNHGRVSGQKRKQTKQVYLPKASPADPAAAVAGAMVVVGRVHPNPTTDAMANKVLDETSDDSNKKQKKNNLRSADLAEAVNPPHHSQ